MTMTEDIESSSEGSNDESSNGGAGVKLEFANKQRILANLRAQKVKVEKDMSNADLVGLLVAHYHLQRTQGIEMVQCDRCNGVAPEALSACPFCGEPNESPESSAIGGGESEPDTPRTLARSNALARVEPAQTSLVPARAKSFEQTKKDLAAQTAERDRAAFMSSLPPANESSLEEVVGEIQGFKRTFYENSWDIGNRLLVLAAEDDKRPALWRMRKKEGGQAAPAYDSWKAFLRAECGFSDRMARTLMHMSRSYRRDEIMLTGTSKIEIVLNAPEPERKRLLERASTTPVRELRAQVRDLNIAAGKAPGRRVARQERAVKERAVRDAKSDATTGLMTLVLASNKSAAWLWKREKDAKGNLVPAEKLDGDNYGWIEGKNGVRFVFSVVQHPSGQLQVVFEARREDEVSIKPEKAPKPKKEPKVVKPKKPKKEKAPKIPKAKKEPKPKAKKEAKKPKKAAPKKLALKPGK